MKSLIIFTLAVSMWSQFASARLLERRPGNIVAEKTVLLGETRLRSVQDHDRIMTHTCARGFAVTRISVQVLNQSADLDAVVVNYAQGGSEVLNIRDHYLAGGSSRWVNLNGGARCVESVEVLGASNPRLGQSLVRIWGLAVNK